MKTIAVIDDDISIGNLLEEVLHREGYQVLRAFSGSEALLLLEKQTPDLILLDLMLPGLSGEEVLQRVRQIPTIIVSAKVGIEDKVSLLLDGAADYVTKPFNTSELLARIVVALRRQEAPPAHVCRFSNLALDTASRTVRVGDTAVALTKTEYAILKLLMHNPNQLIAKSVILDRIAGDTLDCTESSLKTHISHLRTKLRQAGGRVCIESVWGIGFKLSEG